MVRCELPGCSNEFAAAPRKRFCSEEHRFLARQAEERALYGREHRDARRRIAHLPLGDDCLNRPGKPKPQDQRPEHLPGHAERIGESLSDLVTQIYCDEHASAGLGMASDEQ